MKRLSQLVGVSILFLSMVGCASKLTVDSSHDRYPIAEIVLPLTAGKTVSLTNAYNKPTKSTIYGTSDGVEWFADLQQYTDSAIRLLTSELEKRQVSVKNESGKSITLRVFNVKSAPGWTIQSSLIIEAKLGNGKVIKVLSENNSPASAYHSVDGAIMRGITRLMKNEEFAAYINK